MHMHKEMKEGVVSKEVKELQKAGKTLKDTPVVKADKTDTPNYKGNKFGVKEDKDWIQNAVKRPGAFTRKAKAAGMGVQQFAKMLMTILVSTAQGLRSKQILLRPLLQ